MAVGGAAIGLAVPLGFCLAGSVNVWDIMIWGSVTLILQLIAFRAVDFLLGALPTRIEADERSAAIFLAMMSVAIARSEEHTSELQSLISISSAVFCLKQNR